VKPAGKPRREPANEPRHRIRRQLLDCDSGTTGRNAFDLARSVFLFAG